MKGFFKLTLGLLVAAMMIAGSRAGAQAFGLSVVPSANSVLVSNNVTYAINATNLTGLVLNDVWVTNSFSAPFQYITNSVSQAVAAFTNATSVWFDLGPVNIGGIVQVNLTVQPTTTGFFTNSVTIAVTNNLYATSTNTVVQVTNVPPTLADLGVTMTGPKQIVITNDWMTYGVTVTNAGPNAAPNVTLTNTLPPGIIQISPTNQPATNPIPLGTLPSGSFTNLFFTVEPTNIAVLTFSASVGASTVTDTNTVNNTNSISVIVTNYLPGLLVAVTNSPQTINFQNALTEQSITLSNAGLVSVPAARIVVASVTNQLFNGVGTNNGNPFVYYSAPLAAGQTANLLLQYYPRGYFPFTNSQLSAFAVPLPNWTPPAATTGTNVISRIVQLANGNMLIEWPSTMGQAYTVVYSTNVSFSNAMIAPPPVVAPANRTQWIDYGPPTTVSTPTNSTARFYRVIQNP